MVCGGMISLSDRRPSGFGQFNRSLNGPSARCIMQKWRSGVVLTSSLAQHAVEMRKCAAFVICKRYARYRGERVAVGRPNVNHLLLRLNH